MRSSNALTHLLRLVTVAAAGLTSSLAIAEPVTYTLILMGTHGAPSLGTSAPSGSLGGVSFGGRNTVVTLTYHGDTADVTDFTAAGFFSVSGQENFSAAASSSVQVNNSASGAQLAQGNFLPSAGIYVSVDHDGGGIGFGSKGGPVGSAAFPGNPVYPAAFIFSTPYDLRSSVDIGPDNGGYSCVGFPTPTCGAPVPLQTDVGALSINTTGNPFYSITSPYLAYFSARTAFITAFADFRSTLSIRNASFFGTTAHFKTSGKATLGVGAAGINLLTDPVTLQIMAYSAEFHMLESLPVTVPAGSFKKSSHHSYAYQGTIGGVTLSMRITPTRDSSFTFSASGSTTLLESPTPIGVALSIGNNSGVTGPAPSDDD